MNIWICLWRSAQFTYLLSLWLFCCWWVKRCPFFWWFVCDVQTGSVNSWTEFVNSFYTVYRTVVSSQILLICDGVRSTFRCECLRTWIPVSFVIFHLLKSIQNKMWCRTVGFQSGNTSYQVFLIRSFITLHFWLVNLLVVF